MTSKDIEIALTRSIFAPFHYRRFLIVPNVSWGLLHYECDLLVLTQSGYLHEIEIKISLADIKRDLFKKHQHNDRKIRCLWFAIPKVISDSAISYIPQRAGIITINKTEKGFYETEYLRKAKAVKSVKKVSDIDRYQLARLGTMRYWNLRYLNEQR